MVKINHRQYTNFNNKPYTLHHTGISNGQVFLLHPLVLVVGAYGLLGGGDQIFLLASLACVWVWEWLWVKDVNM